MVALSLSRGGFRLRRWTLYEQSPPLPPLPPLPPSTATVGLVPPAS